jgi:hypothetical protein
LIYIDIVPQTCKIMSAISRILLADMPFFEGKEIRRKKEKKRRELTRLAMAAAEARSGLPDTLRCAARGRPLPLAAFNGAPFAARLVPAAPVASPWTVE